MSEGPSRNEREIGKRLLDFEVRQVLPDSHAVAQQIFRRSASRMRYFGYFTVFFWVMTAFALLFTCEATIYFLRTMIDSMEHTSTRRVILDAPDSSTLAGKRDRAILSLYLQADVDLWSIADLNVADFVRQGDYDMLRVGRGKRKELRALPAESAQRLRAYIEAAGLGQNPGPLFFRPAGGEHSVDAERIDVLAMYFGYKQHTETSPEGQELKNYRFRATIVDVLFRVAIALLVLAAGCTVVYVSLSRRTTLRQVNSNLLDISRALTELSSGRRDAPTKQGENTEN